MSLIASVLFLDRQAMKALRVTDPYSLHRVIYSLYEDIRSENEKNQSKGSGFLYDDQGGDYFARKILMLSDRPPAQKIDGMYGEVSSKAIPDGFLNHQYYRFKVVVNPTRRDSRSGNLVAVRGREAVSDWFSERSERSWGFSVEKSGLQVERIDVLQFKDKNQRAVTIGQAHVSGNLQVSDRDKFKESFSKGIGRARAYGCGLLQIVPLANKNL